MKLFSLAMVPVLLLLPACAANPSAQSPQVLDSPASVVSQTPTSEVPWFPRGFFELADEVAGNWIEGAKDPCGSGPRCWYWTLDVVSKDGCRDGLFVNVNFLNNGTVVDDSIDSVNSLRAGQKARFQFWTYDRSVDEIEPTSANCY